MDISSLLSPSQRKQILEQKITGWAAEAYGLELIRDAILSNDPAASTIEQDISIRQLTDAIQNAQKKLAEVEALMVIEPLHP